MRISWRLRLRIIWAWLRGRPLLVFVPDGALTDADYARLKQEMADWEPGADDWKVVRGLDEWLPPPAAK